MASSSKNKLLAAYSSNKKKNAEQNAKISAGVPLSTPVSEPVGDKAEAKVAPEPKKVTSKKPAAKKPATRKPAAKKVEKVVEAAPSAQAKKKAGRPVADARSEEKVVVKSVKITEREDAAMRYMTLKNPSLAQLTIFRDALDEYFEAHGIYVEMEKMGLI